MICILSWALYLKILLRSMEPSTATWTYTSTKEFGSWNFNPMNHSLIQVLKWCQIACFVQPLKSKLKAAGCISRSNFLRKIHVLLCFQVHYQKWQKVMRSGQCRLFLEEWRQMVLRPETTSVVFLCTPQAQLNPFPWQAKGICWCINRYIDPASRSGKQICHCPQYSPSDCPLSCTQTKFSCRHSKTFWTLFWSSSQSLLINFLEAEHDMLSLRPASLTWIENDNPYTQ